MQQLVQRYIDQLHTPGQVIAIPREVYNGLDFWDQLGARALEQVGTIRIVD
jgi:hypothetical protein